ncbi:DUF3592 domain-containing protein [Chamaesiphon sp. OTE_75_metabat_556]|uniref:DUF3592 domain-containing protein n=1 Tax=Chamaesiphon sp. OTE_75_metabat_556 TaxID=2964692 RepID=UPI00286BB728|nr:DUF3592 domain-containing protein [Chamaesiphon sp. OTE_75_metabat_556]
MEISNQTAGLIVLFLALCSGAYLLSISIGQQESKQWLSTRGEMLESIVESGSDGGYVLSVRYAYTVQGHRYVSDRYSFCTYQPTSERAVRRDLLLYPAGGVVTVYYNPRKPADAVLDRHIPIWLTIFWMFFTGFLNFVGVGFLLKNAA